MASKNPGIKSFTWSQKSPKIFCRLDYWLISNNLQDLVISNDICPAIKTDHAAIIMEVGSKDNQEERTGSLEIELFYSRRRIVYK